MIKYIYSTSTTAPHTTTVINNNIMPINNYSYPPTVYSTGTFTSLTTGIYFYNFQLFYSQIDSFHNKEEILFQYMKGLISSTSNEQILSDFKYFLEYYGFTDLVEKFNKLIILK